MYSIAAEPGAVWFGTWSYLTGVGAFGGVGRYDRAQDMWTRYTHADGLALDDVVAVAVDAAGRRWFGTWGGGLSRFDGRNWWTFTTASGLSSNFVRAIAAGADEVLWVGTESGVDRFVPGAGGSPPVVTTLDIAPTSRQPGAPLRFHAQATDPDGGAIVTYEWRSDLDGPLGSEGTFTLPTELLRPGVHTISVRALDDDGIWSTTVMAELRVAQRLFTYLPVVSQSR